MNKNLLYTLIPTGIIMILVCSFQSPNSLSSVDEIAGRAEEFAFEEQYDSAEIYFESARKLAQQKKLRDAFYIVLEKELAFWLERTDLDNSLKRKKLYELWVLFKEDSKFRQLYFDGQSSLFLDELNTDSFNFYYQKTLKEIEANSDWNYEVLYNTLIAQKFLYQNEYLNAYKYLNLAEKSLKKTKDPLHSDLNSFYFFCNEFFYATGDYEKALRNSLICLDIVDKTKPVNIDDLITALNNVAVNYDELEDTERALIYYKRAIELVPKANDAQDITLLYENLGDCYKKLGMIDKAKDAHGKSLEVSSKNSNVDNKNKIRAFRSFAEMYLSIGQLDSAFHYATMALERNEKFKNGIEFSYEILGRIAREAKDFNKSKYYLEKAEPIFLKKYGEKNVNTSRFLFSLANVYIDDKNYKKGLSLLQRAIAANTTEYLDSVDYRKNPDIRYSIDKDLMINQLRRKSMALDSMRVNKIEGVKAVDIYNASKAAVDLLLFINQSVNYRSKSLWLNKKGHTYFQHAIYYALLTAEEEKDKRYKDEAFLISERSRSILLYESLHKKSALHFAGVPDSLLEQETSLKKFSFFVEKKKKEAINEKNEQKAAEYELELLDIQLKIDKITQKLKNDYPEYYQLKYQELKIKPSEIMAKLDDSTVLIEYYQGKFRSFVFVIKKNSYECHQIVADSSVTNRILDFQRLVSDLPYALKSPDEYFKKYNSQALGIYELWLKPFLSPEDKGKRLVIISDGSLSYLPFDALLTKYVSLGKPNYKVLPYLLKEYTINYDYSAHLWLLHRQPHKQLNGRILAMAPTYSKMSDDTLNLRTRFRTGKERNLRDGITDLPGADYEIKFLKNKFKGFYPTKLNASERVWKQNSGNYGILHLAMHGLVDETEPELSSLVFAEDGDAKEDNFLYAHEIKEYKLNASLVVLSACETGVGKYQRGEGVLSVGRGFMYSGVPSILMTIWKLNDQSASELVSNFYGNLQKGLHKDKALKEAKLSYIQNSNNMSAHPALWACFVQLGDYTPIKLEEVNYFNYMIISILLAAILILLIYLYRRK